MQSILIVDDDPDVRKLLIRILVSENCYNLYEACDAAEARRAMQAKDINLILTDIEMPGESGIDLAWHIKQYHPDTGIVLISIIADLDTARAALEIGLYGYLLKPFDRRQVVITVANALRRQELEIREKKKHRELEREVYEKTRCLRRSLHDIEQARAEMNASNKVLRDQLLFLQTLLDAIPHPVFYKDLQGFFLGCNGALEAFFGMDKQEIIGRQAADILSGDIAQNARTTDVQLLNEKTRVNYETRLLDAQDQAHNVIVTKALYTDAEGQPSGIVGILLDITEKLVMERELLQSQKMASIGQLAAGVAHEINNPTGFVSSNLRTLEEYRADIERLFNAYQDLKEQAADLSTRMDATDLSAAVNRVNGIEEEIDLTFIREDIEALIKESHDGTERIKKIVEDLKNFAHPGQDRIQDTDINKGIETTLNIVNNELKYNATVIKAFGELPIISANPQQLNQVFANILVNAAQALHDNGEICIETRANEDFIEIRISDTGCGIPEENLEKIFDPFFTTKEVGKGTGLGMNIAYNIIKKHHGEIQVESRVGNGTAFTIRLPVAQPAGDSDPEEAAAAQAR